MAAARKMVEDWAVKMRDRGLLSFKDTSGGEFPTSVLTLLGEVNKVSSPTSPDADANADADADARRDFSSLKCTECNVTGHSSLWGGCPTRLAKAAAAKNILHLSAPSPAPAASSGSPSQAPSIHPLSDSMTVSERALHGYNEKLLNILNVLVSNTRSASTMSATDPILDPATILQAFSSHPFGH